MPPIQVTKITGEKEPWDPKKLERSLLMIKADKHLASEIVRHIEKDLGDGMDTGHIFEHAYKLLKKYEQPLAARYSLKKALMQLGPSGFPFERFVAAILNAEGYKTSVGIIVKGMCVEHEVDVVAEKPGERILVEAKFHNTQEIRSDVKVALYVHARFQDIKNRLENSAAGGDTYTRSWLITNTNFTSQAIRYGECAGIAMTGWNYPHGRTLQDLVEDYRLHPVTCLTTLNDKDKQALLAEGVVLCKDVVFNPAILTKVGFGEAKIRSILKEGNALCGT